MMTTAFKQTFAALALACAVGCGGSDGGKTDTASSNIFVDSGTTIKPSTDGGTPDVSIGSDAPAIDTSKTSIDAGTCPILDCTGLTEAQCHDRIINPPCTLDPSIQQQDPTGTTPSVLYPACTAT